jgi:hypothetical protein
VSPHTAHNWDGEDGAMPAVMFLCDDGMSGTDGEQSLGADTDSMLIQCRIFGDRLICERKSGTKIKKKIK